MMPRFEKHIRAQTAMELAVFGAILIFVVGAIVRQALDAGSVQNEYLRAMRQAMATSYRHSAIAGDASHQTASILFIEDRLTAGSAKYGALDRTPYMMSAQATYSRTLFLPVDADEDSNLPVFDMFINGKHFPFTTAAFKTVELAKACKDASPCPAECLGDCTGSSVRFSPDDLSCRKMNPCPAACGGDCSAGSTQVYPVEWEPNCVYKDIYCRDECNIAYGCDAAHVWGWTTYSIPPIAIYDCDTGSGKVAYTVPATGCARAYDVVYNHPAYADWCDDDTGGSCLVAGPGSNLSADERFDLDHNGTTDVPVADRKDFAWQWYRVWGLDEARDRWRYSQFRTADGGEGIIQEKSDCKEDCKQSRHTSVDVDGDLDRESIMVDEIKSDTQTFVIKSLIVMDMQEGDMDMTRGNSDLGPNPGLLRDARMYARTTDGTYLLVEEGKLYTADGDAGQYIRTTSKKDQIDLVERTIQLSNDTGRFCFNGAPTDWVNPPLDPVTNRPVVAGVAGMRNPVEACSDDCFSGPNTVRTCMDLDPADNGTQPPVIFVRSRVVDRRGRKWITSTEADEGVKFTLPSAP